MNTPKRASYTLIESEERQRCPVCGGNPGRTVETHEMMFGSRDEFRYVECEGCVSLWLVNPPATMADYYPHGYYSLSQELPAAHDSDRSLRLRTLRTRALLALPSSAIEKLVLLEVIPPYFWWLSLARTHTSARIADLGSGNGDLIKRMAKQGFTNLWGFDPFSTNDSDEGPVHIRKGDVSSMTGEFDLVMMNHSLEHIQNPRETLTSVRDHLAPGGTVVVRLPIADSFAATHYGPYWVALDPPRHFFVPSRKGMDHMTRDLGFQIKETFFDSTALQFWGSELYRRGLSLTVNGQVRDGQFSRREKLEWTKRARHLNALGKGDNAGFVLCHSL